MILSLIKKNLKINKWNLNFKVNLTKVNINRMIKLCNRIGLTFHVEKNLINNDFQYFK